MEQLGEKQDFEAELSRRGFRHEEFMLHVEPGKGADSRSAWNTRYEVKVTHAPTMTVKAYQAGPRENWVARFAKDLVGGVYGEPTLLRSQVAPKSTPRRHRPV
jgi:hypothetical protein